MKAVRKLLGITLLLASACGGQSDAEDTGPWSLLPPVVLETEVAYVEKTSKTAFLLDPAGADLKARTFPVAKSAILAVRRHEHEDLLVLCRGEPGKPGVPAESAELVMVSGGVGKATQRFRLASRFNALAQTANGRFVIAYFAGSVQGQMGGNVLFNPNEIAILDLDAATPMAIPRTIRSFGGFPLDIVFSPELNLLEGKRTLAVLLSVNYVTLLDLDNPQRPEITVPLSDNRALRPAQVLFETSDKTPAVYVRLQDSDDIHVLRLIDVPADERPSTGNDFTAALSQLTAGSRPADMALFGPANNLRLLVVSPGSREAHVIDARTSRSIKLPVTTSANRIVIFKAAGPGDPQTRTRALLIDSGGAGRDVVFLDLDGSDEPGRARPDTRSMSAPAQVALVFRDKGMALIQHAANAGGFSVIDLARRTASPIQSSVQIQRLMLGVTPSSKLWIALGSQNPGATSSPTLGFLNLDTLTVGDVRLDAPVGVLLPLGRRSDGRQMIVVDHGGNEGFITVLDADKPERASARSVRGFLLQDLLSRGVR